MDYLSSRFGIGVSPDEHEPNSIRAVIGLHVGQQDSYDIAPEHTIEGVREG
jgi:hypothetical protein